jgi:uncharacterized protein YndB with AHSA1/START domain
MPNTVRLHSVLATSPEKVYRAFLEPDALAKWLPPNGFACSAPPGTEGRRRIQNVVPELHDGQ